MNLAGHRLPSADHEQIGADCDDHDQLPRPARAFIRFFLVLIVLVGITGTEIWPLTSFHLFSAIRTERRTGWTLMGVNDDGSEIELKVGKLPPVFHYTTTQIGKFNEWPRSRRDEVCDAWAETFNERFGYSVQYIQIFKMTYDVRDDELVRSKLVYVCGDKAPSPE